MPAKKLRRKKGPKVLGRRVFRVSRSRTGLGVFATKPIRKNAYIVEYTGPLLTNAQCDARRDNRYWFEVNARWTIDGASRSNVARYINHSCRPNADPMIRDRRIHIKAIRNIEPGDEITYDYGKDHFNAYIKPHGCQCDKCRAKRARERAEVRAANARKRKRAERMAAGRSPI
ncbi:MAG: SET domain-containing protein [Alphaproteobacteria bacterium]